MLAYLTKAATGSGQGSKAGHRYSLVLLASLLCLIILIGLLSGSISIPDANVLGAMTGGGIAAAATAAGTLPVLFAQRFSQRSYDCMLGFGGGLMLGATAFSLVVPALTAARAAGSGQMVSNAMVGGGILGGALLILLLDWLVSSHSGGPVEKQPGSDSIRHAWMFVAAVALHNVPEGLAIGVAFAGTDAGGAQSLATAIAIQDVPEGLVVALALWTVGYGRLTSAALGAASGLVEPLAAGIGVITISLVKELLPLGLALAAGAMLFVIVHNVIPESHKNGHSTMASLALTVGFTLMTILDTAIT